MSAKAFGVRLHKGTGRKRASNHACAGLQVPSNHHGSRRSVLTLTAGIWATAAASRTCAKDFLVLPSGLQVLDIRDGTGESPKDGDAVEVHWAGFTAGYQGKRIDNTSARDEPYRFRVGSHEAIGAFEEAVKGMRVGGVRRIEVPGAVESLGYPLDRKERFTSELFSSDGKIYKYRYGPQPVELGGQRALDFVLDNKTLRDFNRNLVFDIKLLAIRKSL